MAYDSPSDHIVVIVGGLGNQNLRDTTHGGGARQAEWDAGSPSDFIGTNGQSKDISIGAVVSDNGSSDVRLTNAGDFTNTNVGVLVACNNFSALYDNGVYVVTATDGSDYIDLGDLSYQAPGNGEPTVNCIVGGAWDNLQDALDHAVIDRGFGGSSRTILTNSDETIASTINVDAHSGSADSHIVIRGVNSSLVEDGTRPVITTNASLANGLVQFFNAVDYTEWHNIDFNANGANKADYCVFNPGAESTSNYHVFVNCIFRNAVDVGAVLHFSGRWYFISCEFCDSGYGILLDGSISVMLGCSVHDNTSHGIQVSQQYMTLAYNLIYGNGDNGVMSDSASDYLKLIHNTSYGNTGDGFQIDDEADMSLVVNNSSVGNGAYGYDLQGKMIKPLAYFSNNHSYNNTTAHYSEGIDSTFADFRHGSNQTGNPKFTGPTDFLPDTGSDLIGTGLPGAFIAGGSGSVDIGAVQSAGTAEQALRRWFSV